MSQDERAELLAERARLIELRDAAQAEVNRLSPHAGDPPDDPHVITSAGARRAFLRGRLNEARSEVMQLNLRISAIDGILQGDGDTE